MQPAKEFADLCSAQQMPCFQDGAVWPNALRAEAVLFGTFLSQVSCTLQDFRIARQEEIKGTRNSKLQVFSKSTTTVSRSRVSVFPSGKNQTLQGIESQTLRAKLAATSSGARALVHSGFAGIFMDWRLAVRQEGTWCSGTTSASHAESLEFRSQCVHFPLRDRD